MLAPFLCCSFLTPALPISISTFSTSLTSFTFFTFSTFSTSQMLPAHRPLLLRQLGTGALLDGIQAAASIVRTRLLHSLHAVSFLTAMPAELLETLCDALSEAPFVKGECVSKHAVVLTHMHVWRFL